MTVINFVVSSEHEGKRLDNVLKTFNSELSRANIQKYIKDSQCYVDNKIIIDVNYRLKLGQNVKLNIVNYDNNISEIDGKIDIILEDKDFIVCNKPANITVHPCPSCKEPTFVQMLIANFPIMRNMQGQRPGIVHRIDKETSGLLLVALTEKARMYFVDAFSNRTIHKEYLALVYGKIKESGECTKKIGRNPVIKTKMAVIDMQNGGKPAYTSWKRLWVSNNDKISLVKVRILTGRTHQIRVHLAHLGHPIVGDKLYATGLDKSLANRQMLHAFNLEFVHPSTNKPIKCFCHPPNEFVSCMVNYCKQLKRIVVTGGVGCGKSTMIKYFKEQGFPCISADEIVKEIYLNKGEAYQWLSRNYGDEFIINKGVNREKLFNKMVLDDDFKNMYLKMIHDIVFGQIQEFWDTQEKLDREIAIAEIPLYFEGGWQNLYNPKPLSIGVFCNENICNERFKLANRNIERMSILQSWQIQNSRKKKYCDFVFDNSGSIDNLKIFLNKVIKQVRDENLHNKDALEKDIIKLWS